MRLLILGTGGMAAQHAEHFAAIHGVERRRRRSMSTPTRLAASPHDHDIAHRFASSMRRSPGASSTPSPTSRRTRSTIRRRIAAARRPASTSSARSRWRPNYAEGAGDDRGGRGGRRRQHGQPDLPQRRRRSEGARRWCRPARSARSSHVEASYLQSWLVSQGLGRLAHRGAVAVAAVSQSTARNGVLGDIGIHILDFASYGAGPATSSACMPRSEDLPQGRGRPDRRLRARRQRQLRDGGEVQIRRARHDRGKPLHDRPRQRFVAGPARHQGRHQGRRPTARHRTCPLAWARMSTSSAGERLCCRRSSATPGVLPRRWMQAGTAIRPSGVPPTCRS